MGKLTIIGNDKPVIGKQEMYSVTTINGWLNPLQPIKNPLQVPKAHWEVMVQTKTGWRKGGSDKEGQMVPYIFGQKSLFHKGIKIIVRQGEDYGELIVHPQRAKEPKITRVELLDANYKPIPKGKKLSYKDTIIARAYCVEMFEMNIAFTLWEDDAQGEGHNPTVNALNKINPIPVLSRVNEKGMAEAVFRLPFYTMAVMIANARTASGDKNEGATHEYYVTADVVSKHIQKASPNINVVNPTHNPEPPRKREVPKGHTPAPPKPKTIPAPEKPKPKPDGNSAKFPVTTGGKKSDDPQGKILSAEFVDGNGNRLHSSKVGTAVAVKITAKGMKNKKVKIKIWEEDNFSWTNDLIHEKDCVLVGDTSFVGVLLTKEMFNKAKEFGTDSSRQDYFIEVIHNDTSVKSAVMPVSADATPTEIPKGNSPVAVDKPQQSKATTSCVCKEQYKDMVWGEKVSCEFRKKVVQICSELWGESKKVEMANELMTCMALETQHSFLSNKGYPNATGLVQFTSGKYGAITAMNETGYNGGKNITKDYLKDLTPVKQLDYVKLYFKMWMEKYKKNIKDSLDMYMTIWCPAAVGQADSFVCYSLARDKKNKNDFYDKNKSAEYEYYDENEKIAINRLKKDSNRANGEITKGELRPRLKYWKELGKENRVKSFSCAEINDNKTTNEKANAGYYAYRDGSIKYIESNTTIDYYVQTKEGSSEFKKIGTLNKNKSGVVRFPDSGQGFNRYGTADKGGKSNIEVVGEGDHYLKPETAAALFGVINEINDNGWEIHLGDMSSSNGSDPWQEGSKHHKGHGHLGKQSGQNIDFRYLNKSGKSFHGTNTSSTFDKDKNATFFAIAYKYGFQKNYATGMSEYKKYGVNPAVPAHNDHGHLGLNNIKLETVVSLNVKIIK